MRAQERNIITMAMMNTGSFLDDDSEKVSLTFQYQTILDEVVRAQMVSNSGNKC
jgi:hypothetical protein